MGVSLGPDWGQRAEGVCALARESRRVSRVWSHLSPYCVSCIQLSSIVSTALELVCRGLSGLRVFCFFIKPYMKWTASRMDGSL